MAESITIRTSKIPDELTSRELRPLLESILSDLQSLAEGYNDLLADYDGHVHGGVTVGVADTAAAAATAVAVTLNTSA
jgi:acyl-coenzyme A thioesterase PaaI-like protein